MGVAGSIDQASGQVLHLFVSAFIGELARVGVVHVCVCPGSRSTPLALLLHEHSAFTVWTHLDERSAAFFALGIAKAGRKPVALVATSGTASVNFAPAVVEAYYARVPLLVLTADRPPELRAVGAPQTIDQTRLYGTHVKWFVEMILPEASAQAIRYARTVACRAASTALADGAGPVHINFPFREPLIPIGQEPLPDDCAATDSLSSPRPAVTVTAGVRQPGPVAVAALAAELRATRRGLIVCGPQDDPHFPQAVARLAAELDFPLLADPLSQVRCGPHCNSRVIDSYDAFLRNPQVAEAWAPSLILRFGATPVSKPLLLYLQQYADCRQVLIDAGESWHDPGLTASAMFYAHPASLCEGLLNALHAVPQQSRPTTDAAWLNDWQAAGQQARTILQAGLGQSPEFSEPRVFAELANQLPAGTTVFAGNSMPVRDLDSFFAAGQRPIRFLANRGASGIDGVVSSALGASIMQPDPLVLVIGDISLYHDLNGLLAARRYKLRATIILLHNDGGGIFSFLPQAAEPDHFEELFGTPHGLDFRPIADMYDLVYQRPADWTEFRAAVRQSLEAQEVTIVEVRTERRANAALHRRLWEAVGRSVRAGLRTERAS